METEPLWEYIYDLACGNLDHGHRPEYAFVANEFEEGCFCGIAYEEVFDAYSRVCDRLHAEKEEDPDLEIIMDRLLAISRYLAKKMFEYGAMLSAKKDPPPSSVES